MLGSAGGVRCRAAASPSKRKRPAIRGLFGDVTATARALHIHPQSVRYHGFDAATRLARRPERIQLPKVVVREERRGDDGGCIEKTYAVEDAHNAGRILRPRKKFRLVSVASATPEHRRLAQCRIRAYPYRPAGPAIASPPARNGGCTTDRVASGQVEDRAADAHVDPAAEDRDAGHHRVSRPVSGAPRRRSRALALGDERASQTTFGRRPLGTTCERVVGPGADDRNP